MPHTDRSSDVAEPNRRSRSTQRRHHHHHHHSKGRHNDSDKNNFPILSSGMSKPDSSFKQESLQINQNTEGTTINRGEGTGALSCAFILHTKDPITLHMGDGSTFWKNTGHHHHVKWESPEKIKSMDVNSCYFSDLNSPEVPLYQSPQLVNDIHFDGFIAQKHFDKLLLPLANLKHLEIHLSTLQHLHLAKKLYSTNNAYLQIPTLEALQISAHHFLPAGVNISNHNKILDNIVALLGVSFPKLHYLALTVPLDEDREDELTTCIFKCLGTHRKSLKSFNLEIPFTVAETSGVRKPTVSFDSDFLMKNLSSLGVKLESLHIFTHFDSKSTEMWKRFAHTQTTLKYFNFWCIEKYYPLPLDVILKNSANLHTISVNISLPLALKRKGTLSSLANKSTKKDPLDCTVFQSCHKLETLVIKKNETNVDEEIKSSTPDVKFFSSINKGIKTLRLINLALSTEDTHFISKELTQLEHLYLEEIGEEEDLGMKVSDIARLLSRKEEDGPVLKTIHIRGGINGASLIDLTQNGEDERFVQGYRTLSLLLLRSQHVSTLRAMYDPDVQDYDPINDSSDEEEILGEENENPSFLESGEEPGDESDLH